MLRAATECLGSSCPRRSCHDLQRDDAAGEAQGHTVLILADIAGCHTVERVAVPYEDQLLETTNSITAALARNALTVALPEIDDLARVPAHVADRASQPKLVRGGLNRSAARC